MSQEGHGGVYFLGDVSYVFVPRKVVANGDSQVLRLRPNG